MSNHSSDFPKGELPDFLRKGADEDKLGATKKWPFGKLHESDEGEIRFAIATDFVNKKIIINFGKPVAWMGMTKEQAIEVGRSLIKHAEELV